MGLFALLLVGGAYVLPHGTSGPTDRIAELDPLKALRPSAAPVASRPAASRPAASRPAEEPGMAEKAAQLAGGAASQVARAAGDGVLGLVRSMDPRAVDALAALPVRPAGPGTGYAPSEFGVSRDAGRAVSLASAWRSGAAQWPASRRRAFAKDPLNAAADEPSECAAAAREVAVRSAYGLSVTTAERARLAGTLIACPDEPLP